MISDGALRAGLWATAALNLVVALAVAVPTSALGQMAGLPAPGPAVYNLLLAWTIALFGVLYAGIARQAELPRLLVLFGALGKAGVFILVASLWARGAASGTLLFLSSGDLAFATFFLLWAQTSARA